MNKKHQKEEYAKGYFQAREDLSLGHATLDSYPYASEYFKAGYSARVRF